MAAKYTKMTPVGLEVLHCIFVSRHPTAASTIVIAQCRFPKKR
jgi:hypothetical protein